MAEEKKGEQDPGIQDILNDLDAILSQIHSVPADLAPSSPPPEPAPKPEPFELPPAKIEAPKPQTQAAPAPPLAAQIPANVPKEQIRRVAFLYTAACREAHDSFVSFLEQSALTISKKPLYLRRVVFEEVSSGSDAKAVLAKVQTSQAVVVLGILEGLPEAKIRELGDAFASADVSFRSVARAESQRRSLAVDIIVDVMLLAPES